MDILIQDIGRTLAGSINGGFKFVKSKLSLVKKEKSGWKGIAINLLSASQPKFVKLALYAQIRIDYLELLYTPHHPFLSAKDARGHATLSVNCDQLFTDKSIVCSFESTKQSVAEAISKYSTAIKNDILPFLDNYFSEDALVSSFINPNPKEWVTSDRLTRYLVLLSVFAQRADWQSFNEFANEFSKYCLQPHAQVYKPLADSVIHGLYKGD